MIGIDTNVLVRLIADDDLAQSSAANLLRQDNQLFVSLTVVMESEWVLRSAYRWSRRRIADALAILTSLENLDFELVEWVEWAIARYLEGADFADMIHIVANKENARLATFDKRLSKQAGTNSPTELLLLKY